MVGREAEHDRLGLHQQAFQYARLSQVSPCLEDDVLAYDGAKSGSVCSADIGAGRTDGCPEVREYNAVRIPDIPISICLVATRNVLGKGAFLLQDQSRNSLIAFPLLRLVANSEICIVGAHRA